MGRHDRFFQEEFPRQTLQRRDHCDHLSVSAVAEDGSVITSTSDKSLSSAQNLPLLTLASQKFHGHLVIQNNSLYVNEPAQDETIQSAQSLGTLIAFQTNEDLGGTGGDAASGGRGETTPCGDATYIEMLETGIYPLGKTSSLRAQYIEVFAANVNAFPGEVEQAHLELLAEMPPAPPPPAPPVRAVAPRH